MEVISFETTKDIEEYVTNLLQSLQNVPDYVAIVGENVYINGDIVPVSELENYVEKERGLVLGELFEFATIDAKIGKYWVISDKTNIKLVAMPSYPRFTVPIFSYPLLFLQVTGDALFITDGTKFVKAPITENIGNSYQLWKEGDDWILHIPSQVTMNSFYYLQGGLYRIRPADNPFGCKIVKYDREDDDSKIISEVSMIDAYYKNNKVIFADGTEIPVDDFKFERITVRGKLYFAPRQLIKRKFGVGKWKL